MELQLGLALPPHSPMKGLDLNSSWIDQEEMLSNGCSMEKRNYIKMKHSFVETFEHGGNIPTEILPLIAWSEQPNEEDDRNREKKRTSNTIDNDDGEENRVVGWPPIKSWRKKLLHGHQVGRIANDRIAERGSFRTKSMYVKVKMEGVGIARKVDLRLYRSYQTLTNTLISMFTKFDQQIEKDSARYTLLYQDNEGDWLLAGDVPWQTFIESVQRMEILRNAG